MTPPRTGSTRCERQVGLVSAHVAGVLPDRCSRVCQGARRAAMGTSASRTRPRTPPRALARPMPAATNRSRGAAGWWCSLSPAVRSQACRCPQLADPPPLTPDRHDYHPADELSSSGLFATVQEHRFGFSLTYTADEFLALIGTYASHETLSSSTRSRLHEKLRDAIEDDLNGIVTKPYGAVLVLGRRRTAIS